MLERVIAWVKNNRQKSILIVVGIFILVSCGLPKLLDQDVKDVSLNKFQTEVAAKQVTEAELNSKLHTVTFKYADGKKGSTAYAAEFEDELIILLREAGVDYKVTNTSLTALLLDLWPFFLMMAAVVLFYLYTTRQEKAGRAKALTSSEVPNERFSDVIGADEVLEEVRQIVRCLKRPRWFRALGVRPLTGVVLYGPPGTGKTLLAKAVAGEAGVPFYPTNGSEFDDQYMGVGASRVRQLFADARKHQVAIVFIDEIDAIGSQRGTNTDSGTRGYNQTLNALLAEMDGFAGRRSGPMVIVIGATNMLDSLDPALTRPGRLTRKVAMPTPDRAARLKILQAYAARLPNVDGSVNLEELAKLTSGMSGADLAELVNQAGLTAERERNPDEESLPDTDEVDFKVQQKHFMLALESAEIGPERKSIQVAQRDRRITSIHEAGHAIAGQYAPYPIPPRKVTIVPRGRAGGVTWATAGDEQLYTVGELKSRLIYFMGARVAEHLLLGDEGFTTGAHHDLQQATNLAKTMVCELGMIGEFRAQLPLYSGDLRYHEIDKLIVEAEKAAMAILVEHRKQLEALADALLEEETIEGEQLKQLIAA